MVNRGINFMATQAPTSKPQLDMPTIYYQQIRQKGLTQTHTNFVLRNKTYSIVEAPNTKQGDICTKFLVVDHGKTAANTSKIYFWSSKISKEEHDIKEILAGYINYVDVCKEAQKLEQEFVEKKQKNQQILEQCINLREFDITTDGSDDESDDDILSNFPLKLLPSFLPEMGKASPFFTLRFINDLSTEQKAALSTICDLQTFEDSLFNKLLRPRTVAHNEQASMFRQWLIDAVDQVPQPETAASLIGKECCILFDQLTMEDAMEIKCSDIWKPISKPALKAWLETHLTHPITKKPLKSEFFRPLQPITQWH